MLRRFVFRRVACAVALLMGMVPAMQGAVQSRIVGGAGKTMAALPQSVPPRVSKATDLGPADGSTALTSMTLRFSMTDAQKAALTQLLQDQQNPASAKYRQWLTPEQFAAQFGLSGADITTVSDWLTSQGFKITATARSATFIQFSGTVAQAQAAFQTSIHRVSLDGEEHIANVTAVSLPSGIAGVVGSVAGLDDFRLKPRARVRKVQADADPKFTSSISGNHYIAPGDFYTIYDVKPLLTSSINGTGITIAVAGQTDINLSDMAAFRTASGLSANAPTIKLYGADPGVPLTNGVADDEVEADLDVEWSGAVAPSASILYVNSVNVIDSLVDIIDNKLAPIASTSYGLCESQTGAAEINTLNQAFMQANAEGITVVGPAGDAGATDCDYQVTTATQGLAVDFPASSPFVTGLGGTMFNEGSGSYFSTSNDANGGSALSYIPEAVWNETTTSIADGGTIGAGGGGVSIFFNKPSWQTGTGVPNDFSRDVPDVALNAASIHDGYLFCSQGSCVNGYRDASNNLTVVGGTSVSTPSFAGILALVQQKIGAATANANPVIYALANSSYYNTVFHDVTVGNNASPCTAGSTDCPSGGDIGYNATTGYDLASGWGSVDAFNLANSWTLVTPATGGATGASLSTTSITASSTTVASGTSVTITATVARNAGDTNVTGSPSGTVQFVVDNVVSGGAVTLTGGVATFSLTTTGLTPGAAHTVIAVYSGDTNYAGSKASTTVNVTAASTTTVTASASTVTAGTSVTITATVANGTTSSLATPTGTVQFMVDGANSGGAVTVSNGVATFSLGTSALALGAHTITAVYAGSTVYSGSQGSVAVTVTASTKAASTTAVTASASSVTIGTSVTITATVANGTTSSLAAPTGTVQFLVNGVNSGSAVTLSGGAATFTFSTTGLAAGSYTIAADYSGDTAYAGSQGSVTVAVASAGFTLSPTAATVTTASGTDAPGLVFTVTPNGFTGSVAFSASTTSSTLNAQYSFSVTPVVISSPTTAETTTLTLSAYVTNAIVGKGQLRLRPVGSASAAPPAGMHRGWIAGSGAAIACVALLMLPRRRKFGALLGVVMAAAALGGMLGMSGCGGGTSTTGGTTGGNTNTTPGTYTITVTATGTPTGGTALPVQSATVTFVVQ